MAHSNGIITAPISLDGDVCPVLGLSSSNTSLEYVCSNEHGRTNKWSRAKPYQVNSLVPISIASDPTRISGQIWGMKPPKMSGNKIYFNSMAMDIISQPYQTGYPNWVYQAPKGGGFPCRLTDWEGYNHNANQVFTTGITNYTQVVNLFDVEKINFYFMLMQNADFTMAQFADAFLDYRFVVEVYVESGTPWYAMSAPSYRFVSANKIKDMQGWSEDIEMNTSVIGGASLENKSAFICMGIQNFQGDTPEGGTGIVAPWVQGDYPFYKELRFQNYFNRSFKSDSYAFTAFQPTWYNVSSYPVLTFSGTRVLFVKCRIERKQRRMYVVPQNPSGVPSGAYSMKIKATAYGSNYTTEQYATLTSSTLGIVSYTIVESTSSTGVYQDIYLRFDNLLRIGQLNNLSLKGTIDNGSSWVQLDAFTMNVTCR